MKPLARAIKDYLTLRRSLGFKLRDAGIALFKSAAFLQARGTAHVTTQLALEWVQQTPVCPAINLGAASWLYPRLCALSHSERSANRDSATGSAAVSATPSASVLVLR